MLKNTTYDIANWMETLNPFSRMPYLPTTFYGFQFDALSAEKFKKIVLNVKNIIS